VGKITQDQGIAALRHARVAIEEMLADASSQIIEMRETIQRQAERIGELETKLANAHWREPMRAITPGAGKSAIMRDAQVQRWHRIATGIHNRIKDGHAALALIMAETLKEELNHGYGHVGRAIQDSGAARSESIYEAASRLGAPYCTK